MMLVYSCILRSVAKNLVTLNNWYSCVGRRKLCFNICFQKVQNFFQVWWWQTLMMTMGVIFWFGLFPSMAQLSSAFHYFSCFPVLQQILSWRGWSWHYFAFVELIDLDLNDDDIFDNDWSDVTHTVTQHSEWHTDRDLDIMTTATCRAAAIKMGGKMKEGPLCHCQLNPQ